jgi:ATP-dependent Lon protease
MDESGLAVNSLKIDDAVWPEIIRPLGYDSGIRSLERTIETICRKVARAVVEGKISSSAIITISPQNVKEFITNG